MANAYYPDIRHGDCRTVLADLDAESVQCCITSPPYYGLRDYGVDGQMGMEQTPGDYVAGMVDVFREVRRVLRDDGTVWLNLGDSYGTSGGDTYSGFNQRWSGTGGKGNKQDATLDGIRERRLHVNPRPKNLLGIPWRVAFALQAD
ncbi:MAG: site-specific DNA-methyltransferase, partial [bacterium]|nr:site-specific DNA-methyltransferase [bacterium]